MEQTITDLTDTYLKGLRPGRPRVLRDEKCSNLFVFVSKRAVTYKFKGERRDASKPKGWATQSATLGPVDRFSVASARAWAYGLRARVAEGDNPNRKAVEPERDERTVADLWAAFADDLARRGKDPYNHLHYGKFLQRDAKLWAKPVRELTRPDVTALHASITRQGLSGRPSPYSANRTRECLSAALNFAREEGWGITENVARGSKRLRNKERKRNESIPLDPFALHWWWGEVQKLPPVRAALHSITLLLGLRNETAIALEWDWVDLADASMTIPAHAMKVENEWWCPLPREAVAILSALPRHGRYVFAVRGRDGRWTHIKEVKQQAKGKNAAQHPLRHAVGGKLRTAYRTAHDKVRSPHAVAEYLHGHVVRGITAHYVDPTQMREEFRAAQQRVADYLTASSKLYGSPPPG